MRTTALLGIYLMAVLIACTLWFMGFIDGDDL